MRLSATESDEDDIHFTPRFPAVVGWWNPAEREWSDAISGIIQLRTGLELFPLGAGHTASDLGLRLSGRMLFGWRMGRGDPDTYGSLLNSFTAEGNVLVHFNFTRQQGFYLGGGPLWTADVYSFKPKYEGGRRERRRGVSVAAVAGYEFRFHKSSAFFAELGYSHALTGASFDTLMPAFGVTFGL